MLCARDTARWILKVERAAVAVRIGRMMHSRRKRSLVVAISAAEHADHALALALEAAPKTDEFEFLGDRLGEPKRRFDRLRAAREQLQVCDPVRQQRGHDLEKARASFGGEAAKGRSFELLPEALDVVRMAMADAADGDAPAESEIFVAVDVGDRATLCVVDDNLREE